MKITVNVKLNLKTKEATEQVKEASRKAMRDTVVEVANDSIDGSPKRTGNNMRSIKYESSGFNTGEGLIDQSKIEGAIYSTSGYGGYLETGTYKMAARPYFRPALDKNFTADKFADKVKGYLK